MPGVGERGTKGQEAEARREREGGTAEYTELIRSDWPQKGAEDAKRESRERARSHRGGDGRGQTPGGWFHFQCSSFNAHWLTENER
jgi:hypothetical protein